MRVSCHVAALVLGLFAAASASACTVVFVSDREFAIAGDNEDWTDPNTQIWFVPATTESYGIVYLGFGLGKYPEGGFPSRKLRIPENGIARIQPEDLYGFPQQGMNEKGLFFGGAATPTIKAQPSAGKQVYDGQQIVDLILRKCASVEEALKLIKPLHIDSDQGQWMFADRSGDAFILEAGNVIVRKHGRYLAMTNFLQSRGAASEVVCPRFKLVERTLADDDGASIDSVRSLLKATRQQSTQYSTIFDLTRGEIHVFDRGAFDRGVKLSVQAELAQGERAMTLSALFQTLRRDGPLAHRQSIKLNDGQASCAAFSPDGRNVGGCMTPTPN